jgi:ABC-type transporter Mla subunit MlaD
MIRRVLTALVVLGACVAAVVLTGASGGDEKGKEVKVVFDNAFGLVEGGDLKIAGARAGKTTKFEVTDEDRPKAVATVKVTQPGFDSFRKDARCDVRQQSLIGEYYIDCQPGTSKEPLPNDTVPVEQTASTIPLDLVNNVMRRPYRERLRLIVSELGTGLAGRPQDLNEVIRRAHPGLRETSKTLEVLGRQNKIIQDFIADSDTVVRDLERNKRDVARWIVETGKTAEVSASRREAISEQFRRFPGFLAELQPTMARLGDLTDAQTPLLRDLRTAAPDLRKFFDELGPFADASRPSIRSLGEASVTGREAIRESSDEIRELRALAVEAPRLGKPLRQFLQTLDDRKRAFDKDDRYKETAPPAPDPTAVGTGNGFTGMEDIWNYFFWQTLAINPFDEVSHFIRVLGIESECGEYNVKPTEHQIEECNRWLGPYQPGVTDPDPTDAGGVTTQASTRDRDGSSGDGGGGGGDGGRGDGGGGGGGGLPEEAPKPGERDLSKPEIVLPPALDELLDKLRGQPGVPQLPEKLPELTPQLQQQLQQLPQAPQGQGGSDPTTDQLLNFLLAP